ncbi:hypothetical protein SUDANB37_03681 [Streptomyces sp. enrichment culture]
MASFSSHAATSATRTASHRAMAAKLMQALTCWVKIGSFTPVRGMPCGRSVGVRQGRRAARRGEPDGAPLHPSAVTNAPGQQPALGRHRPPGVGAPARRCEGPCRVAPAGVGGEARVPRPGAKAADPEEVSPEGPRPHPPAVGEHPTRRQPPGMAPAAHRRWAHTPHAGSPHRTDATHGAGRTHHSPARTHPGTHPTPPHPTPSPHSPHPPTAHRPTPPPNPRPLADYRRCSAWREPSPRPARRVDNPWSAGHAGVTPYPVEAAGRGLVGGLFATNR